MKKHHLVSYDYGTGGVWAVMNARSKEEILEKYPKLVVNDSRPKWMSDECFNKIPFVDIDDPPTGWLTALNP
jgi:hypothetical protein